MFWVIICTSLMWGERWSRIKYLESWIHSCTFKDMVMNYFIQEEKYIETRRDLEQHPKAFHYLTIKRGKRLQRGLKKKKNLKDENLQEYSILEFKKCMFKKGRIDNYNEYCWEVKKDKNYNILIRFDHILLTKQFLQWLWLKRNWSLLKSKGILLSK